MQYRAASFTPAAVIALALSACGGVAHAQTEPPIETPVDVPQEDGPPPGGPGEENRIAIGIGGAYMPAYHGSDKHRFQPLPAFDIKLGRFFVNFQDGIGATLIDNETVTVGAGVVMADNYRAKDAPRGIGKLPFGAGARGFVKWRLAGFEATLGGTQIFAGSTKGFVADASISRPIMVSQKLFLNPSIGTTWANEKHLNRYFGVNARQSTASGLPQYRLKSGFMDVKAELGAQYRLTDSIGIGLVGGVTSLTGDAKESPIVKKRTRPYGIFFISYEF
jgi:outer membrane protein